MKVNQRGEACYSSFQELAEAYNIKPVSKVIKDKKKFESQKEKFSNRYKCRACGEPLTWVGDNVMTCTNSKCRGIKHTTENSDGTKSVYYTVSYSILDEDNKSFASYLFS